MTLISRIRSEGIQASDDHLQIFPFLFNDLGMLLRPDSDSRSRSHPEKGFYMSGMRGHHERA